MEKSEQPEPALLDHPLIPEDDFHKKLRAIMSVPKAELDERLERERIENEGKVKRGPKKKI